MITTQESRRSLSLRAAGATILLLVAVVGGYYGWRSYRRHVDLRWLVETAVPQIEALLKQNRVLEARRIYRRAERIEPGSKLLYTLAEGVAEKPVKFETAPAGAKIYISDYTAAAADNLSEWELVGQAPLTATIPAWGYFRVRAIKAGFAPADQVLGFGNSVAMELREEGTVPQGMVWVSGTPSTQIEPAISLPGFWIDRYEITNRQFQQFVDAGGYNKPEYWEETFIKVGRQLPWEQAISEFHDLTGRPGPANWILGAYPEGAGDLPVAGVSWYEARAYCRFVGKSLPTVDEFRRAAPAEFNADVALMSNFDGRGPARAGAYHGMNSFGTYDMAGNVTEWTANTATGQTLRYALGGAWDEASYQYGINDVRDPFSRTISLGLRCVKRTTPAPAESFNPIPLPRLARARTEPPVDDATYRVFADYHRYVPSPLESQVTYADGSSPYWIRETVSLRAAYANDRVIAHLFLPKNALPPYQVIIVFGGSDTMSIKRIEDYVFPYEFLVRSGRAVLIPAYWGTLERGPSQWRVPAPDDRDRSLKYSWDLSRSVDYLQTRSDIDVTKLGFYGVSWGAIHAPRLLAVDARFKSAALVSGGLFNQPREVDSWNFAPRYHVPTLMLNGKQDFFFPYETNQKLLFDALGTPPGDKKHLFFDGGHRNPITRPDVLAEILKWFDHYLGRVQER